MSSTFHWFDYLFKAVENKSSLYIRVVASGGPLVISFHFLHIKVQVYESLKKMRLLKILGLKEAFAALLAASFAVQLLFPLRVCLLSSSGLMVWNICLISNRFAAAFWYKRVHITGGQHQTDQLTPVPVWMWTCVKFCVVQTYTGRCKYHRRLAYSTYIICKTMWPSNVILKKSCYSYMYI